MIALSDHDQALLDGAQGEAAAMAMRVLVRAAAVMGAPRLLDIESAHIDGCLYHGQASLDFVEKLVGAGGKVVVPTTLNVGSMDLIHPELFRGGDALRDAGTRLMQAHLELGCESTFTCAPYQLQRRPRLGQQIAWAESNAIVFANSVLGARTNRYGDFMDLCAALTGRAPCCGLHLDENRRAGLVFAVEDFPREPDGRDIWYAALGLLVGKRAGGIVPAITGLPADTTEDELKALGAAAASSGAVALFHAVGITPEASTLEAALGVDKQQDNSAIPAAPTVVVRRADLRAVRASLNQARPGDPLAAVSVGTPHFSLAECAALERLLSGMGRPCAVDFYVNTSRYILWELESSGLAARLRGAGVQFVTDTCTYITPIMRQTQGLVMTNSGKWAHYAPANIGVSVAYGSLRECVRSAVEGKVCLDDA
ncbi:aconitase X [Bordetella genomosp. 9]|uniref:Aconitase subunit 1 n=1 Tax=Bordetella genomosp. 9 TaxID=1416803 RepID=A0A1W6YZS9_9BORD|nr:aconitase X catalytic domain-containing protein [Bordetella genomosp. 9]ARP86578.1 aconitase subunit 1 [Bordetella genomosp. 9]ARP90574.1 aconitase subunit 1 [Bordetella genomosp. 9]